VLEITYVVLLIAGFAALVGLATAATVRFFRG
jgi:hypothetical protein